MAKPETGLRQRIIRALKAEGWLVDSNPASAATGPGRSDLTVCARGMFVAVEIKTPSGIATPAQVRYMQKVHDAGGLAFMTSSPEHIVDTIQRHVRRMEMYPPPWP